MPNMPTPLLTLAAIWLLFFIYSIMGWVIESTYCSIPVRRFVNRGFLNGPYIPIYGSGAMISALLLSPLGSPVAVFVLGGALSCLLEYTTSAVMEKLYHARWWDYSDKSLNLNGRIWIGGFFEFGIGCVLVAYVSQPLLLGLVGSLSQRALLTVALVTLCVFLADFLVTHFGIAGLRSKMDYLRRETISRLYAIRDLLPSRPELAKVSNWDWVVQYSLRTHMGGAARRVRQAASELPLPQAPLVELHKMGLPQIPSLDEMAEAFSSRLSRQELRILQAFPEMRPSNWRASLEEYYQHLQESARSLASRARETRKNDGGQK